MNKRAGSIVKRPPTQTRHVLRLSLILVFTSLSAWAHAGAKTDGSLGPVQNLSGNFVIPQNLGTTKGGNLFHSFQTFNIDVGESANFTTTTALQNVIARVTGGTASSINGLLQLTPVPGNQPHFYFINPAGVIFGAGAAVDVPAGLHISTADYIKFADGKFFVDSAKASTLSAAAPEAFGFLGNNSAAIEIKDGAKLTLRPQQALTLAAGDISINNGSVLAPASVVSVAAVGKSNLELAFNGDTPTGSSIGISNGISNGKLSIVNAGSIDASGNGNLDGGQLRIQAGDILLDGQDAGQPTGIFSNARTGFARSGDMVLSATRQLTIMNGARISSSTSSAGNAGSIKVDAAAITIDGQGRLSGIFSQAGDGSGQAGNIDVTVGGKLALLNGGVISSSTFSAGNAGSVSVTAKEIVLDGSEANGPDTGILSTSNNGTGNAGNVSVSTDGKLSIISSAQISSATYAKGAGANVAVTAGELLINGNAVSTGIKSISGGAGNAGNIDIKISGAVSILSIGGISSSAFDRGNAGQIKLVANSLYIDGQKTEAGIYSDAGDFRTSASFNGGSGGNININIADKLTLTSGGRISSTTYTRGQSGNITVTANSLALDGQDSGILAETIGVGNAGNIAVKTGQVLQMENGARISSATHFVGNAGSVNIDANSLTVDGKGLATGIYSDAGTQAQGNAGNVDVNVATSLALADGGQISSATISSASGSAGAVKVKAATINLDGKPATVLKDDDGHILNASTGIFSSANAGGEMSSNSTGNAGTVNVSADVLQMSNGAQISSSAYAQGKAGEVTVGAATIRLASNAAISSEAGDSSSGYAGNINVQANKSLELDHGVLSIRNAAQLAAGAASGKSLLAIDAPLISLQQSQITASATGNAAASDIHLSYAARLLSQGSSISTSAYQGNGGAITINGSGPLVLAASQVTTSVTGTQIGNGGDITITAPAMILRSGFIQANTAAKAASGGNVNIQVNATIASGNQLLLGGQPQKFGGNTGNLIQAAAPDGINGVVRLSSPQVDFSANLLNLSAQPNDLGDLAMDLCRVGTGSSLSPVGRGGLLPSSAGLVRP